MEERYTIKHCAEKLECTEQFLRVSLQLGKFEFGHAVKYPGSKKWTYWIDRNKFERYVGGK